MTRRSKPKTKSAQISADGSETEFSNHRPVRPAKAPQARPTVNDAESPLSWLRTRRGQNGQPLISDVQYLAGERLRSDFERAMLMRRTTTNWEIAGSGGGSVNAAVEVSDGAIAARQRYQRAMDSVGPELNRILQHICCMAAGMEEAERALSLPQRSGKAVLGLALTALARHYGLLGQDSKQAESRQWGTKDYRPVISAADGS